MARKRKAGDGTVRQRKDSRWEGRIVIGYDDNGYPKTNNVLAKTKKECVEKLQKLKAECGGLKPEKVRPEMAFGDWLTYWYENHSKPKIRPTTQETYGSRIRLLNVSVGFGFPFYLGRKTNRKSSHRERTRQLMEQKRKTYGLFPGNK